MPARTPKKTTQPPVSTEAKESTPIPVAAEEKTTPANEVSFASDVLPILQKLAPDCHTPEDMAGNYALNSYEAVMAPGTDSVPNVIPGEPEKSLLYIYLQKGHPFGKKARHSTVAHYPGLDSSGRKEQLRGENGS